MILITGAAGKTGQAVIRALTRKGEQTRGMVHRVEQTELVRNAGARDIVIGDLLDREAIQKALVGADAAYLICPNVHPKEFEIAQGIIAAAKAADRPRIVYHSVMYPQIESMPHHWQKLRVEQQLIMSRLPFTILQPASYMQNILAYWDAIRQQGEYLVPYSIASIFSPVDLEDIAEIAGQILTNPGHDGSIYMLAGPQRISSLEMADLIAEFLGIKIKAKVQPLDSWIAIAKQDQMAPYSIDALVKMFNYYDRFGFAGSSGILEYLLGRPAAAFSQFLARPTK